MASKIPDPYGLRFQSLIKELSASEERAEALLTLVKSSQAITLATQEQLRSVQKELEALKKWKSGHPHSVCVGHMVGDPPRYEPDCVVLAARVHALEQLVIPFGGTLSEITTDDPTSSNRKTHV